MRRPPKYDRGEQINDLSELIAMALQNSSAVVWVGRPRGEKVPGRAEPVAWTVNRAAISLDHLIRRGYVARVVVRPEYRDWLLDESAEVKDEAA